MLAPTQQTTVQEAPMAPAGNSAPTKGMSPVLQELTNTQAQSAPQGVPTDVLADPTTGAPPTEEEIANYFNKLPEQDKGYLAAHLTPEFVRAIGIVSGPDVAKYLDQFADKEKVLVPVPRQIAEKFLQEQAQSAPQGVPQPPQGAPVAMAPSPIPIAPSQAPQGMMTPS